MPEIIIVDSDSASEISTLICGVAESKFGQVFLALDGNEGICYSAFIDEGKEDTAEYENVRSFWPKASLTVDNDKISRIVDQMFDKNSKWPIYLKLSGSNFQNRVWKAIASIKEGTTANHEDIATAMGSPTWMRGIILAIEKNRIAYFIPCHRILLKGGGLGRYKWGDYLRRKLLMHENAL